MLKRFWIPLFLLFCCAGPTLAQNNYDGLKLMGSGQTLVDKQSDSTMTLRGFLGKYDEKVIGIYITQHGQEVRFYMDQTTWDTLKQSLIKTRDQWETISPTQFAMTGDVKGFRVANVLSTMRISIEGANDLDNKRVAFSLNGGGNTPKRVYASINFDQVKSLVEQFNKVDEALRGKSSNP